MRVVRRITFLLVIVVLCGCESHPIVPKGKVYVEVWQNDILIKPIGNTVALSRKSFELRLKFTGTMSVLVNAHSSSTSYDQATRGLPIKSIDGFYYTGMAEYLNNKNFDIALSKKAPSMWFYNDNKENRCDKIERKGYQTICIRTVKNINLVDNKSQKKVEEYAPKNIYIVFISYSYDSKLMQRNELDRDILRIKFKE